VCHAAQYLGHGVGRGLFPSPFSSVRHRVFGRLGKPGCRRAANAAGTGGLWPHSVTRQGPERPTGKWHCPCRRFDLVALGIPSSPHSPIRCNELPPGIRTGVCRFGSGVPPAPTAKPIDRKPRPVVVGAPGIPQRAPLGPKRGTLELHVVPCVLVAAPAFGLRRDRAMIDPRPTVSGP
jgi:hypothetical protein